MGEDNLTLLTSDKTLRYNAKDCVATLQVHNRGCVQELTPEYEETYKHTMSLYDPLMYMMIRGIAIDLDALAKMKTKVGGLLIQYQDELNALCGRYLNPNSSEDCKKYFYVEKGIPPYTKRGKKGSTVTCDDKALQRLARGTSNRAGLKEAKIIQRMRQLQKLKGTYLDIIFDADKRLRCSYNPRGTRFARISSSKTIFDTGMNMQNLPPAFMQFLVADPGKIIINLDKRQAEWVVMAYISGDAAMINAIESKVDAHAYTAANMFSVPMEVIRIEHKVLGTESDPETIALKRRDIPELQPYLEGWLPRTMSLRQCGKKSNHGLNYDETAKMFSLINEITEKEAQVVIDFYHGVYPGIGRYYETTRGKLTENRTLHNLFGRPYTFRDKWGPDLFKSAYSFIPQSTVGELVNRAMRNIYDDASEETKDLELMMQVHDNIAMQDQFEDLDRLVASIRVFQKYMDVPLSAGGRDFRIGTDLKIGFTFGTLKELSLDQPDEALKQEIKAVIDGAQT